LFLKIKHMPENIIKKETVKMKKLIVGTSWKMRKTVEEGIKWLDILMQYIANKKEVTEAIEIFLIPSFLSIYPFIEKTKTNKIDIGIGAQNCCWEDEGAFTGELSPMHLKACGARYVELGHAERIEIFGEDYEMIRKKVMAAKRNGLEVILCIGEKEKNDDESKKIKIFESQIMSILDQLTQEDLKKVIIAYEPVWAIGQSESAPMEYINNSMACIRDVINKNFNSPSGDYQRIIYGGSVFPETAKQLLSLENNSGIFVGRGALNVDFFIQMVDWAVEVSRIK